ncbi:PP2C family protein-serine/threonine phosphatase [Actinokineospora sp. G85]|uniref:PP2C family protein-serine/threonine phosphatase n=1 Tax=Actinokineospora sp. G85 TaxID=3406626 RepID=UPI003C7673A4
MSSNPHGWQARLHALWRLAFRAVSTRALAGELYPGLLALPGVHVVLGARLSPRGAVRVVRWADGDGLVTAPAGLDADLVAWAAAPVAGGIRIEEFDLAEVAGRSPGLAARLAGCAGVVVAGFPLEKGEQALLVLGVAALPSGVDTELRQACEVVLAADERVAEQRAVDDERAEDAILAEASLRMAASLDIEDTLRAVVRMAVPGLADGAAVHLERDGEMRQIASAHVDARRERLLTEHLRAGRWAGEAVVRGQDRSAWDDEPRPSGLPAAVGLDRMTISVLRARGRVVGLLTFFHRPGSARQASGGFLRDLAGRAALSIDNASLYEARREDVLSLQQHLLPTVLPAVPGLEVAAAYSVADNSLEVGGDFYGVVEHPGGEVTALIGDVCGRGAPAAGLTGLARHTVETLLGDGRTAEHALDVLNTKMLDNEISRFLTLATATFHAPDADGVAVRALSAGHPPPMVVRRDGSVEAAGCTGRLIGVLPDLRLSAATARLRAGDCVVLHTDGLIEARDAGGRFFGDTDFAPALTRLRGLPLRRFVDELVAGAGQYEVGDDAAVLAVRHRGRELVRVVGAVEEAVAALRAALPDRPLPPGFAEELRGDAVEATAHGDARWARVEVTARGGGSVWAELG